MHEQVQPLAAAIALVALIVIAFALGRDIGQRGQAKQTRKVLQQFGNLLEDVKQWRSTPTGTAYSRGYSEGYTDCLSNVTTFLERHTDEPPRGNT